VDSSSALITATWAYQDAVTNQRQCAANSHNLLGKARASYAQAQQLDAIVAKLKQDAVTTNMNKESANTKLRLLQRRHEEALAQVQQLAQALDGAHAEFVRADATVNHVIVALNAKKLDLNRAADDSRTDTANYNAAHAAAQSAEAEFRRAEAKISELRQEHASTSRASASGPQLGDGGCGT